MTHEITTQLVSNNNTTTSLQVAEVFGKQHKHVLRDIEKLDCSPKFSQSNFRPRNYTDDRGKTQPMFEITRDGFSFLAMGYTGKKAAEFKEKYIAAFNQMELYILQRKNEAWLEPRKNGKIVRLAETDAIKKLVDYAIEQGSTNAQHYYSNITKMTYKALEFFACMHAPVRDFLNSQQLMTLGTAEAIVGAIILDGINKQLPYKQIYANCKHNIEVFAGTIPASLKIVESRQLELKVAA